MKEKEKIDQWLQKSMADFRPELSDSARERFLSEAPVKGSRTVNGSLFGSLAVALILSVTAFIWWTSDRSDNSQVKLQKQNTTVINHAQPSDKNGSQVISVDNREKLTSSTDQSIKVQTDVTSVISARSLNNGVAVSSYNKKADAEIQSAGTAMTVSGSEVEYAQKPVDAALNNNDVQHLHTDNTGVQLNDKSNETNDILSHLPENVNREAKIEQVTNEDSGLPPAITDNNTISEDLPAEPSGAKVKKEKPVSRFLNQSLSLYYRPEIVWNVIDNEKLIHNFGAEWQTRLFSGNYLLGTGMGISFTRGYYEYAIEYNEFLGNYQQLDSITFEWNPREFSMQHTVHTSQETVFDTAVKVDHARVYRDFVYLQIPFTMGYDFINKSKYSVGIRFVPVLSVLLSKKPVDFRYEAGKDRIVQINRITPDRVHTNWQLNAGINYSRRLSETFWMELEPRFSYYFNSVYEKSDNSSSPMGASIRVAVGIKY